MKPHDDKWEGSVEYQLAQRVLKAWEAAPVDDNGFGEKVILARAYMAMVEERVNAQLVEALDWALRRIRTSLDTGDLYAKAEAALDAAKASTTSHERQYLDTNMERSRDEAKTTPSTTRLSESPLAWLVFVSDHPEGWDYVVFPDEHEADSYAAEREDREVTPLYRASAFAASATRQIDAAIGHDAAQKRIEECVREIEILCDAFGYDPVEWLSCTEDYVPNRTTDGTTKT